MANSFLTIDMITRESVALFRNSNAFLQQIKMQYDDQYAREGAKIGATLRIRLPNDYTVTNGPALSAQSTVNQITTLTVGTQRHVDLSNGSFDMTLKIQDFSENLLAPMVNNLAANVASTIMSGYTETQGQFNGTTFVGCADQVCNLVLNTDSSGTIIAPTNLQYGLAYATLTDNSVPDMLKLKVVNNQFTNAKVVNSLAGLFNPTNIISKQYERNLMYRALGFDWSYDPTIITHTSGTFSAGVISGANQGGQSSNTPTGINGGTTLVTGSITGTLARGDIITIAGVNAVNRLTKADTGNLRQFVVTAPVASGATSISVFPALIGPVNGSPVQYQTVTASPADQAAISLVTPASSTYRKNLAFHEDAFTMATADLVIPPNYAECGRDEMDGISMRLIKDGYIPGTDQLVTRLDILFGWQVVRPEWAVIVADSNP
jgi:hypothetical protein